MRSLFDENEFGTELGKEVRDAGRKLMIQVSEQYPDVPIRELVSMLQYAVFDQGALEVGKRFRTKLNGQEGT